MKPRTIYLAAAFALEGFAVLSGQSFEQPLRVKAAFSTGYYSTYTRGEADQTVRFVPAGAKFDIDGHLLSPDLLSYSVQPELNFGPQASEAGFQGGNGIRLRMVLLRKRIFPLTFRYSNVQVEDVYFGSLSQVSAYSLKNRNRDLGLTWELAPPGLPTTTVDWGTSAVESQSGISIIPDYKSRMNHLNVDSRYERWGWDFQGLSHWQHHESDVFAPLNAGTYTSSLQQSLTQFQGSAGRSIFSDSEIYLNAGSHSTSSILYNLPIDLTTRFAGANLRLFQKRRWKGSLHTGYSSNLSSQLLAQVLTGVASVGPGSIAPDPGILTTLQHQIANFSVNGATTFDLSHGWGIYGNFDHSALMDASRQNPLNSSYFSTSAGLTYSGSFSWGRLSGQYGRDFGHGSVTGQSGTITGQNYLVSMQHGKTDGLVLEGSVHGTDQSIENTVPISSRNFASEGSVAHGVAGSFRARIGGGWQQGSFQNGGSEFRSDGYTARGGIEHPRLQISVSINNNLGNSLPIYSQLLSGAGLGGLFLTPLHIIPSDFRATTFTIHANPIRKLEFSAMYTHSRQHLDGTLNNDFELLNIHFTYYYRKIQLESGFIRSSQIFVAYPETRRGRLYVRISRSARIL